MIAGAETVIIFLVVGMILLVSGLAWEWAIRRDKKKELAKKTYPTGNAKNPINSLKDLKDVLDLFNEIKKEIK